MDDLELKYRIDGSCWKFIPVTSEGIFSEKPTNIFRHGLILLELQLAIIFTLAAIIHLFLKRFKVPRIISEVLAGLILGPTVLGRFFPSISSTLFTKRSMKPLNALTRMGFLFFMFLIGVKMDVTLISKSGKREWTIGSIINVFPLLVNVDIAKHISLTVDKVDIASLGWVSFVAGKLTLTSFPMVAVLLMHMKILNSELGHLTMSVALISDLVGVVLVNLDLYRQLLMISSSRVFIKSAVLAISLILLMVTFFRQMLYWIIRRTPEGKPVKDAYIFLVVIIMLIVAIVGETIGIQFMYAPFVLGLTVPTGHPLASTLVEKLDTIVSGWLLPLMSTSCGQRTDLWTFNKRPPAWIILVPTFNVLVKTTTTLIPALCFKLPAKDATAVALILGARGIIDLGNLVYIVGRMPSMPQEFGYAVMIVFVYAGLLPVLIRKLYDPSKTYRGYEKRTVLDTSVNETVRVLACSHMEHDALSAIKLLQLLNPEKGSPLSVYGLYLEELVGGSSPLLLNHQLGQKSSSDGGRWQPIIEVFNNFKSQSSKPTQVHLYTAISPLIFMHEDACWVSFDNSVSLIILPFHKTWNNKGQVIYDSKDMRDFNTKVLKKAPCSVGILIDRDQTHSQSVIDQSSSTYNVCLIYIGGADDREALAIVKRMIGWPSVFLTVVRFKNADDSVKDGWESMLDDECLREIKHQSYGNGNVLYKEEKVRDGAETPLIVGSISDENYDLIIAGRNSESDSIFIKGLSIWTDFPELGVIGDMLASSENTKPSLFVVQQQVIEK